MNFNIPKELNSEFKFNQYIGLFELVVLGLGFIVAWFLNGYVYSYLRLFWYVFFEMSLLFLTRKSKENPGVRNYKSILLMFSKNKNVYRRI